MKKKTALLVLTAIIFSALPIAAHAAILSPAISVIAENTETVKAGLYNCDVVFTANDFLQANGLTQLGEITFKTVPPSEDGILFIGNTQIKEGMSVSEEALSSLKFRAASEEIDGTEFTYCLAEKYGGAEKTCKILFLNEINAAPTAAMPEDSPAFETYKNVPLYSRLGASDPEGDEVTFRITEGAKRGTVELISDKYGEFKYTPSSNHVGKDSFSYVVYDKYGNFSKAEKVTVRTVKNKSKTVFEDMVGSKAEYAAIAVSASGLMDGITVGGNRYFEPDETVTRAEILATMMQAAGIDATVSSTDKFADFDTVPEKYKTYVATAASLGFINGTVDNGNAYFNPNSPVTRAEAANMAQRICDGKETAVLTFADAESCPTWCEEAMNYALGNNLMNLKDGKMEANEQLNRSECAILINGILKIKK